jgi:hypothetical protein
MSAISISAKVKDGEPVTVTYDMPDTVEGLVEKFGADVVYTKARQSIVIDAQAYIRRQITPNKEGAVASVDQVQTAILGWKPDNRAGVKVSAADKAKKAISSMSADERKELLKSLKAEGLV